MKKQIHLNESELHRLVKESVRRVLRESMNEIGDTPQGQRALGMLSARENNRKEPLQRNFDGEEWLTPHKNNRFTDYAKKNNKTKNMDAFNLGYEDYLDRQQQRASYIFEKFHEFMEKNFDAATNDPDNKMLDEDDIIELSLCDTFYDLEKIGIKQNEIEWLKDEIDDNDWQILHDYHL